MTVLVTLSLSMITGIVLTAGACALLLEVLPSHEG